MKLISSIALLFTLSTQTTHPMMPSIDAPCHPQSSDQTLDLMPAAAKELIECLNNPQLSGQIDCILVHGAPESGKSSIIKNILTQIHASTSLQVDAQGLIQSYANRQIILSRQHFRWIDPRNPEDAVQQDIARDIITPLITKARAQNSAYAVLIIKNFEILDRDWQDHSIQQIMKALSPARYKALNPPLLIIGKAHFLSAKSNGPHANIIHAERPHETHKGEGSGTTITPSTAVVQTTIPLLTPSAAAPTNAALLTPRARSSSAQRHTPSRCIIS